VRVCAREERRGVRGRSRELRCVNEIPRAARRQPRSRELGCAREQELDKRETGGICYSSCYNGKPLSKSLSRTSPEPSPQ
jgi:hypothetical protein